jgi:preprotein translocase subunit SecD
MSKRIRLFIVLVVLIICGSFLYPTIQWYFRIPEQEKELAASSRQNIRDYAEKMAAEKLRTLKKLASESDETDLPEEFSFMTDQAEENYELRDERAPRDWTVQDVLRSFADETAVFEYLEGHYRDQIIAIKEKERDIMQLGLDLSGGMSILLEADMDSLEERLGEEPTQEDRRSAVDRAMEILNNRIDKFGVTEPQIRRQGTDQIAVEIPGAADPDRIHSFLMGKGSLNFHIVNDEATGQLQQYAQQNPGEFAGDIENIATPDFIPAGSVVRGFYATDAYGIDELERYIVIYEEVGLDGSHIQDAQVGSDPITGRPVINFVLDNEGGDIFFSLTSDNVGNTLAIVLDDKVKAGARISEPIRGSVRMSGFDRREATDLALILRTAALPVDLEVVNQQSVGASLGEDSIRLGLRAIALGFILVIIFMLIYYKGAGIVADLALVLNLFIIISILSAFNLTLTLTSIAGIILTVGMAVDANVIIFERIKEEYRLGKSPQAASKAGFRKAFWTIMDANITTFIAAIFLSQLGSGPVQGFAYTLAVGILSSMFTALFVSRLIFDFSIEQLKVKKLSITWRKAQ